MNIADTKIPGRILRPDVKARPEEIVADYHANKAWRVPAQRAIAAVIFWMEDNKITKRALAEMLGKSEQAVGQMLNLNRDFKLSTIGELAQATGLDLFAAMASKAPQIAEAVADKQHINDQQFMDA
jgi:antitoxin component HigA of HigAB toxin-antitoxin module